MKKSCVPITTADKSDAVQEVIVTRTTVARSKSNANNRVESRVIETRLPVRFLGSPAVPDRHAHVKNSLCPLSAKVVAPNTGFPARDERREFEDGLAAIGRE